MWCMDELYDEVLDGMEAALEGLTQRVPPPRRISFREGFVFRYVEHTAQQAIVQKLARIITGLRAAHLLLRQGLVQEQAVIERVLGELQEDVLFLADGFMKGKLITEPHKSFLAGFYQEEFDNPASPIDSTQKRPMVPRRKIQAYLARVEGIIGNPSYNQEVARTLSKAFSGFVHAASPQIMEMFGGNPPHFHVRGMLGTPRIREYEHDIWNYFDRGMATFAVAAGAFGDRELFQRIFSQKRNFEVRSGRDD